MDERRDRFLRVAERRTREILQKIRLLGNCSNKSAYSYTQEEVEQIFSAIQERLEAARLRFEPGRREVEFRLRREPTRSGGAVEETNYPPTDSAVTG